MKAITKIELIENMLKIGEYNKMYRVNYNGMRLYLQEEPFAYYSGLTGALSAATFAGDYDKKRLDKWRTDFVDSYGKKGMEDYVQMTADFGSLLHASAVTIKEKGQINWNEEHDKAFAYFIEAYKEKFLEPDMRVIKKMVYEYQKHVASLLQFCYDNVQEIYAIEVPVKWEELRIATPVDLFCLCKQTPKGGFANTVINIKTSSQISKHQMEQVSCEMGMWNKTYKDEIADFTAILRTKDWKENSGPSYEYKYLNKEDAYIVALKAYKRLELCVQSDASYYPEPSSRKFDGITKIGEQPKIIVSTLQEEWEDK